jgi:hypothetical protein
VTTKVLLARFAPVGTRFGREYGGRLDPLWTGHLPNPPFDDYDDVTTFGLPPRVVMPQRRWEFAAMFDLIGSEPDAVGCRVWLPRVELKPEDGGYGEKLVIWRDPLPSGGWERTVFGRS